MAAADGPDTDADTEPKTEADETPKVPTTESSDPVITEADEARFQAWIKSFVTTVTKVGIRPETAETAFAGVSLNPRVIKANNYQPEFSKAVWDYLDSAVSDARVELGTERLKTYAAQLAKVEKEYGVPGRYIVAIWGIETNYGGFVGNYDIFEALGTLAFEGRRTGYGRSQLVSALKLAEAGERAPKDMISSWAGAVGQTQFIPSTYVHHAVDGDGDGKRDLWSSMPDVFASTANFLKNSGWRPGLDWGREVKLPDNCDFSLVDPKVSLPLTEWSAYGVTAPSGDPLPQVSEPARMILPAGHRGPAFLGFYNFNVILRYNSSTSYAIAVGHLADRIGGGTDFVQSWPRDQRPLNLEERKEMQERLNAKGFKAGEIDGILGAQTRKAIQQFQASSGLVADGFATADLLESLRTPR